MINSFQDFQKVSKVEMTDYMQAMGELNKSWQAIATEMTDYSKRSFEDGVATFQKLATAKSVPEVVEIQTTYAKKRTKSTCSRWLRLAPCTRPSPRMLSSPSSASFRHRDSLRQTQLFIGSDGTAASKEVAVFALARSSRICGNVDQSLFTRRAMLMLRATVPYAWDRRFRFQEPQARVCGHRKSQVSAFQGNLSLWISATMAEAAAVAMTAMPPAAAMAMAVTSAVDRCCE